MHACHHLFCVFRLTMMLGRPWPCSKSSCTWTCTNPNYLIVIVELHQNILFWVPYFVSLYVCLVVHVTEFAYAHGFLFSLVMFWVSLYIYINSTIVCGLYVYNIIHKTISDDRYGFHFFL